MMVNAKTSIEYRGRYSTAYEEDGEWFEGPVLDRFAVHGPGWGRTFDISPELVDDMGMPWAKRWCLVRAWRLRHE